MKKSVLLITALVGASVAFAEDDTQFHGTIRGNANLNYNTTSTQSYHLMGNASRPFMKGSLGVKGFYLYSRQKVGAGAYNINDDRTSLSARYDFDLNGGSLFGYGDLGWDRDGISGLKSRITIGAGVGKWMRPKSALENEGDNDWKASVGLVQVSSKYSDRNETYLGGALNSNYRRIMSWGLRLTHDFTYIPDLQGEDRNLWISDLHLTKSIGGMWEAGIGYLVTHENKPAAGAQKQVSNWMFSIGYKF